MNSNLHPVMQQALAPFLMPHRFPQTYCSQCGEPQGPGNEGFSDCRQHTPEALKARRLATFKSDIINEWDKS